MWCHKNLMWHLLSNQVPTTLVGCKVWERRWVATWCSCYQSVCFGSNWCWFNLRQSMLLQSSSWEASSELQSLFIAQFRVQTEAIVIYCIRPAYAIWYESFSTKLLLSKSTFLVNIFYGINVPQKFNKSPNFHSFKFLLTSAWGLFNGYVCTLIATILLVVPSRVVDALWHFKFNWLGAIVTSILRSCPCMDSCLSMPMFFFVFAEVMRLMRWRFWGFWGSSWRFWGGGYEEFLYQIWWQFDEYWRLHGCLVWMLVECFLMQWDWITFVVMSMEYLILWSMSIWYLFLESNLTI